MSATVLRAIDEDIQMHKNAIEQLNGAIQIELNKIHALETARETFIKVMPVIATSVQVETLVEKPIAPTVPVIEKPIAPPVPVIEKPIAPSVPVITSTEKLIEPVVQDKPIFLLSSDNYLSDDKVSTDTIKLIDRDFNFDQQFDVKCISKEVGKAEYNLTHNGKLLHWINEKGKYSSTYKSGTKFTPFEPLKACLYYREYEQIGGLIYFPKQIKQIPSNEEKIPLFNMNKEEFPSLSGNK
jgi:hypothetical protein